VSQYILDPVICLAVGTGLGIFYFGGLWLTVKMLPASRCPGLLALAGFVVRTAVVLGAFYLVMGGRWERLFASVLGFFIVRTVSVRLALPPRKGLSAS
jgi:F1F0 ATPase subunit 2